MAKPTKEQLSRYVHLQEILAILHTKVLRVTAESDELADKLLEYLEDRYVDRAVCFGFEIMVEPGAAVVDWKFEYIVACGRESAAIAEAKAPHSPKLTVTQLQK